MKPLATAAPIKRRPFVFTISVLCATASEDPIRSSLLGVLATLNIRVLQVEVSSELGEMIPETTANTPPPGIALPYLITVHAACSPSDVTQILASLSNAVRSGSLSVEVISEGARERGGQQSAAPREPARMNNRQVVIPL